jgi:hypothetical protein
MDIQNDDLNVSASNVPDTFDESLTPHNIVRVLLEAYAIEPVHTIYKQFLSIESKLQREHLYCLATNLPYLAKANEDTLTYSKYKIHLQSRLRKVSKSPSAAKRRSQTNWCDSDMDQDPPKPDSTTDSTAKILQARRDSAYRMAAFPPAARSTRHPNSTGLPSRRVVCLRSSYNQ